MECAGYKFSRRAMLGAAGGTFLGLQVRQLVALAGTSHAQTAEHVILFWNGGGMSHIDTFDPKPGRPTQGEFEPIKTSVPGLMISEIFPLLAKQMKHVALIRSIAGTERRPRPGDLSAADQLSPKFATCSTRASARWWSASASHSAICRPISRSAVWPPKAGYLGQKCEAYFVGRPGEKDPYLAFPAGIGEVRGNKRLDILQRINSKLPADRPMRRNRRHRDCH